MLFVNLLKGLSSLSARYMCLDTLEFLTYQEYHSLDKPLFRGIVTRTYLGTGSLFRKLWKAHIVCDSLYSYNEGYGWLIGKEEEHTM
jgi:hypothetical protein